MNHLEIYSDGGTFGKDGSGFAVILLSLNHRWQRSFATGNYSANQASLLAVKFGLLSIANSFKSYPIKLFVRNKYTRDMLERDSNGYFKRAPKANKESIEGIRVLMDDLNVEIYSDISNDDSVLCKSLVENAVKHNKPIDQRK